ncbi:hypothetical protein [Geobacter sp. AOG1]|uniref:hypothetical protein n=1 Tax=Geobacter sp. AOG1 TaxID=1566346 RepID=UPI001CC50D0A|nr:hypothetical protein [Geobacter sp. AOG1]GFE56871.1 hypothetical protein AOG1_07500 [Geobacter sp. AOG1]
MQIPVVYTNGSNGFVPSTALDYLIEEQEVVAFWGSDGLMRACHNPLQKEPRSGHESGERASDMPSNGVMLHQYRHICMVK